MKNKVNEIIIGILDNSGISKQSCEITDSSRLREDLGMDSFNLAELTVYIEDSFNVDIFEDGIVNTVGEIYQKLSNQ